ncbi:hypothetical protein DOY81_007618 [Sarcophaga bullata]|nr:hypothetical protein DOY81_007618 [Sarcophaga bullata]
MLPLWSSLMLLTVSTTFCLSTSHVNAEYGVRDADEEASRAEIIVQEQDELYEMLNTEKVLINTLRHFIESQEQKLDFLKSKTLEVRHIHDNAIDREKYLYNPINANFTLQTEKLTFPTEDDYDAALGNLLRIQDMYQLKPKSLSMGEVNGVKLGSEMTWSDCLEIGLKSRNLNEALRLANEILELQPKQKTVIKAKKQIEKELKRNNGKTAANGNKNNGAKNAKSKAGKKRGKTYSASSVA